jgi:hypothetical protein
VEAARATVLSSAIRVSNGRASVRASSTAVAIRDDQLRSAIGLSSDHVNFGNAHRACITQLCHLNHINAVPLLVVQRIGTIAPAHAPI